MAQLVQEREHEHEQEQELEQELKQELLVVAAEVEVALDQAPVEVEASLLVEVAPNSLRHESFLVELVLTMRNQNPAAASLVFLVCSSQSSHPLTKQCLLLVKFDQYDKSCTIHKPSRAY